MTVGSRSSPKLRTWTSSSKTIGNCEEACSASGKLQLLSDLSATQTMSLQIRSRLTRSIDISPRLPHNITLRLGKAGPRTKLCSAMFSTEWTSKFLTPLQLITAAAINWGTRLSIRPKTLCTICRRWLKESKRVWNLFGSWVSTYNLNTTQLPSRRIIWRKSRSHTGFKSCQATFKIHLKTATIFKRHIRQKSKMRISAPKRLVHFGSASRSLLTTKRRFKCLSVRKAKWPKTWSRSLKTEWVPEMGYRSFSEAQRSIYDYIIGYYNYYRPHHHNSGLSPNKAEEFFWNSSKSAAKITWPLHLKLKNTS